MSVLKLFLEDGGVLLPGEFDNVIELVHKDLGIDGTGFMIQHEGQLVRVPSNFDAVLFSNYECIRVLNDGFIQLVDVMGDQSSIVQAARVSYGAGTKTKRDDEKLIRYLHKNRHTTPFEMVEYKFHVRVPMDCWRQWIRHRTASTNEYSTRYSVAIDSMATAGGRWRLQDTKAGGNKQGSSGLITDQKIIEQLNADEAKIQMMCREVYERRLTLGVAREQARKDLPLSTYTEAYWKIDLKNLLHFLRLRLDKHAQYEIRQYAQAIVRLLENHLPLIRELIEG